MSVIQEHNKVIVNFKNISSTEIYLHGATVTSWKVNGIEKLFLSPKAILDGSKAIRGGIPLVFPHFGKRADSQLPQHGFARTAKWNCIGTSSDDEQGISVKFELLSSQVDQSLKSLWPHECRLEYTVKINATELTTGLEVKNIGNNSFVFTPLLHTYFRVENINKVKVHGFQNQIARDDLTKITSPDPRPLATISQEVDRVYYCKNDITLSESGNANVTRIRKFNFPTVVLWNPWIEKSKGMADFGDDSFNRMTCIEVGDVIDGITLESGSVWEGYQVLSHL